MDINLVIWFKDEFEEIYGDDSELYEIVSVRAQHAIDSAEPRILINWKDESYKEDKEVLAAIEECIQELQGEFPGTEKGEKKEQQLICQGSDSDENDLVYFALDHLSLWEFEKALHQYIGWTVSIDSLEYKIDGVVTMV